MPSSTPRGEVNQRWINGRDRYRRPDEPIPTRLYDVVPIAADSPAKAFVEAHHYSGSYPAARFRFGLYRGGEFTGVAVFSVPANDKVITNALPIAARDGVELGRFVLLDMVEGNGETWFLGRAFELLRHEGVAGVVSFSDPVPRAAWGLGADGPQAVCPGHVGTIYQAHNGVYTGRGTARTLRLLPDGTVLGERTIQKIRAREVGYLYAAGILARWGATPLEVGEDSRAWLATWLPRVTRPLKHRGCHRYVWAVDRRLRRRLPGGQPFPKLIDKEAA
jgi:hypothetical protein